MTWQEEFDNFFEYTDFSGDIGGFVLCKKDTCYSVEETERKQLKDFISNLLIQQRKDILEEVKDIIPRKMEWKGSAGLEIADGYNQCVSEVNSCIKSLINR